VLAWGFLHSDFDILARTTQRLPPKIRWPEANPVRIVLFGSVARGVPVRICGLARQAGCTDYHEGAAHGHWHRPAHPFSGRRWTRRIIECRNRWRPQPERSFGARKDPRPRDRRGTPWVWSGQRATPEAGSNQQL